MNITLTFLSALLVLLLISCHVNGVQSQAYHFSKGWGAGKRSPPTRIHQVRDALSDETLAKVSTTPRSEEYQNEFSQMIEMINNYLSQKSQAQCKINPIVRDIIEHVIQVEAMRLETCNIKEKSTRPLSNKFFKWMKTRQLIEDAKDIERKQWSQWPPRK